MIRRTLLIRAITGARGGGRGTAEGRGLSVGVAGAARGARGAACRNLCSATLPATSTPARQMMAAAAVPLAEMRLANVTARPRPTGMRDIRPGRFRRTTLPPDSRLRCRYIAPGVKRPRELQIPRRLGRAGRRPDV